jgi:hypothetical protein
MYQGWTQSWQGLMKNAHEGMANARLILPFTGLMLAGYVLPTVVAVYAFCIGKAGDTCILAAAACVVSYLPRLLTAVRFDRSWFAASLFPLSILLFLAVQWTALIRSWRGAGPTWRGRVYPATTM